MNNTNNNNKNKNKNNEDRELEGSIFGRSSMIMRSPSDATVSDIAENRQNEVPFKNSEASTASASVVISGSTKIRNVEKLGNKISSLSAFLKTKTNIHKEIHSLCREIEALFMHVNEEVRCDKPTCSNAALPCLINVETQTNEIIKHRVDQFGTPKRKLGTTTVSPNGRKAKKKKATSPNKEERNNPTGNGTTENVTTATDVNSETAETNASWEKVRKKGKRKKIPARPDAIVIQTRGESSYADILRKVKSDPKLIVLGQNVRNIRKTQKGDLLLELNKPSHQRTGDFRHTVEEVLGVDAEVRALTQEVLLEIKDIDEITTKEDVHAALINVAEEFKSVELSAIKSLRNAYGGTQTAIIGLSAGLANRFVEIGKIRIGWVYCRIRKKLVPRRCYKCLDFGHIAAKCVSEYDNSGKCLKCGETGHKIRTCRNNPSCMLCKNAEDRRKSDHVTGCAICPSYKKASAQIKSRR